MELDLIYMGGCCRANSQCRQTYSRATSFALVYLGVEQGKGNKSEFCGTQYKEGLVQGFLLVSLHPALHCLIECKISLQRGVLGIFIHVIPATQFR